MVQEPERFVGSSGESLPPRESSGRDSKERTRATLGRAWLKFATQSVAQPGLRDNVSPGKKNGKWVGWGEVQGGR